MRDLVMAPYSPSRRKSGPGDFLQFRVSALGQAASGTIDVAEDVVNLKVFLPWLLAQVANMIQPLVRKEGTLMLEKK